jgi:hypothetical protein
MSGGDEHRSAGKRKLIPVDLVVNVCRKRQHLGDCKILVLDDSVVITCGHTEDLFNIGLGHPTLDELEVVEIDVMRCACRHEKKEAENAQYGG